MELRPGQNKSQLAATKVAVDQLKVVNANLGFTVGVAGVEVREAVLIEVHRDRDSEKAAYARHRGDPLISSGSVLRATTGGCLVDEMFGW
jgi:alpha-D-ribose 1-methylphosphonate 5-triphosphate synthase subunit PhnI